jgi:hypothetical protein
MYLSEELDAIRGILENQLETFSNCKLVLIPNSNHKLNSKDYENRFEIQTIKRCESKVDLKLQNFGNIQERVERLRVEVCIDYFRPHIS